MIHLGQVSVLVKLLTPKFCKVLSRASQPICILPLYALCPAPLLQVLYSPLASVDASHTSTAHKLSYSQARRRPCQPSPAIAPAAIACLKVHRAADTSKTSPVARNIRAGVTQPRAALSASRSTQLSSPPRHHTEGVEHCPLSMDVPRLRTPLCLDQHRHHQRQPSRGAPRP